MIRMDIYEMKRDNLEKFEEEKEKYNLKFAENYNRKIQEFNAAFDFNGSEELQKMKSEINNKINNIINQISKANTERSKLEDNLKFEEAEKKDLFISNSQYELENLRRRLSIVQSKIDSEKEEKLGKVANELKTIAADYKEELQLVIENAREDLSDRYQKIIQDRSNFNANYAPVSYTLTEVDNTIKKMNEYI